MPEWDKELQKKGMKMILPNEVFRVSVNRKAGYLDDFMGRAILSKGAFYLSSKDWDELHEKYALSKKQQQEKKAKSTAARAAIQRSKNDPNKPFYDQFFDLEKECPKPELEGLRGAYQKEVEAKKQEGCSSCQLNAIKAKYKKMITEKYGDNIN